MIAYLNGTIKLIDEKKFKSKEDGKDIVFNTLYAQVEEDDGTRTTVELNTRQDFSKLVDIPVTIKISIKPDFEHKNLKKLSVIDVTPVDEEEAHIVSIKR